MDETAGGEARHPIGVVAERTGLSQEVLRVWERRYGAVRPERTAGGQRLYTDADVERLRLLRRATHGGRNIGSVARLPVEELGRLVREDAAAGALAPSRRGSPDSLPDLEEALSQVRSLDGVALEALLRRGATVLGVPRFLEAVVAPFMKRVGDEWHGGRLSPGHEHMATSVVQRVVHGALSTLGASESAPVFVVAAPAGERHELGALLAAATAAAEGWRVVYLGPDLPAAEIATAAVATGATAVGVSVVYAASAALVAAELEFLRERLPASVPLLVGGAAASAAAASAEGDIVHVADLDGLRAALRRLEPAG